MSDDESVPAAEDPVVVSEVKKPDLLDRVAAATGQRRGEIKAVVEATLAEMGQALSGGEQLNLQPFGKMKLVKTKDLPNGQVLTVKLRRSGPSLEQTGGAAQTDASEGQQGLADRDGEG